MESIPCNIVILPSEELAQKAIKTSEALRSPDTFFTLQDEVYFPHCSLYMTQLKVEDLEKVGRILAAAITSFSAFNLEAIRYYQSQGYIDVEYARTSKLDELQMAVVDAVNPVRDGMREKDKARMVTATGLVRENFEKFGYPNVGELFRPHITFTRFKDLKPRGNLDLPQPQEFNGIFAKLGLFEMGDNGTCVRKIAEFNLGEED